MLGSMEVEETATWQQIAALAHGRFPQYLIMPVRGTMSRTMTAQELKDCGLTAVRPRLARCLLFGLQPARIRIAHAACAHGRFPQYLIMPLRSTMSRTMIAQELRDRGLTAVLR